MTARHPDTRELVRPDAQPDTVAFARFFSNVAQRASGTTPDDVAHVVAWFKAIDKVDDDGKRLFPNVEYTTEVFNSMLLVLSRQQKSPQLDLALQLYRDAQAGAFPGVVPDLGTFQNLLVAVARSNQSTSVDVALELFHDMVAEDADGNKLLPDALPNRCVAVVLVGCRVAFPHARTLRVTGLRSTTCCLYAFGKATGLRSTWASTCSKR